MADRTAVEGELIVVPDDEPEELRRPQLRADLSTPAVHVTAGETVEVTLQVLNTSSVIETVRVQLLGLMAQSLVLSPSEVTLFPDESGEVTVALTFHDTLPAGEHEGIVAVSGLSGQVAPAEVPLRVIVPPWPALTVLPEPPVRTAGRKAEFWLLLENAGNTPLSLQVRASDADRVLALEVASTTLHLPIDGSDSVRLVARKRRHWTGPHVEHVISVDVVGDEVDTSTEFRFRQKPRLTAGVITLLTLGVVVALWALAMVFGVEAALAPTPPTKMLPATFVEGVGLEDLDPTVVGGAVSGTVTAASTSKPVARATVEAFDQEGRVVAATATDDDGAYVLEGLLPVRHRLRVRAPGFEEVWWPSAAGPGGATPLLVSTSTPREGVDTALVGLPGALGGQAIAGDGEVVPIAVEVRALDVPEGGAVVTTTADDRGVWSVSGLLAPATYRVTYRAPGYAPVEVNQPLDAGQQLVVNTTRLPAATGSITGTVIDILGAPIGGVGILAQRGDTALEITTPTSGEVGFFALEDLETPGTYLLTLVAEGYAPETQAVRLGPGEAISDLQLILGPATGVVSGRALSAAGAALGGVTVTVSGGDTVLATETLTSGDVGSFRLAGLPLPGIYAVTFDLEGYARETVRVQLDDLVTASLAEVRLRPSVGTLAGRVVGAAGEPLSGIEIEVSDGSATWTTTTASVPLDRRGTFAMGQLAPGTYTVTATAADGRTTTVLRTVTAAATTEVPIRLTALP